MLKYLVKTSPKSIYWGTTQSLVVENISFIKSSNKKWTGRAKLWIEPKLVSLKKHQTLSTVKIMSLWDDDTNKSLSIWFQLTWPPQDSLLWNLAGFTFYTQGKEKAKRKKLFSITRVNPWLHKYVQQFTKHLCVSQLFKPAVSHMNVSPKVLKIFQEKSLDTLPPSTFHSMYRHISRLAAEVNKKEKKKKGGGQLQFVPAVPKNKCPEASTIYPSAAVHVEATYWEEVSWSWPWVGAEDCKLL